MLGEQEIVNRLWPEFRESIGQLSSREKLRPAHWQRKMAPLLERIVVDQANDYHASAPVPVERAINVMMESSREWCNPSLGVDEEKARAALRAAVHAVFETMGPAREKAQSKMRAKTAALMAEMSADRARFGF